MFINGVAAKLLTMNKLRLKRLLLKLKAGKKEYFNEFYSLSKGAVWYVVTKYITERFFAEDIMQEAYIAFLNNVHSVNDDPLPYLCRIAANKALDAIKKDRKIDRSLPSDELIVGVSDNYACDNPLLNLCKKRLDDEEYYILENTVVFGYTRVEVAKALNKPVSTVNRRYNKILEKVKKLAKEVYA